MEDLSTIQIKVNNGTRLKKIVEAIVLGLEATNNSNDETGGRGTNFWEGNPPRRRGDEETSYGMDLNREDMKEERQANLEQESGESRD